MTAADRTAQGPRIEQWGGFDVDNLGDALFPVVFEREMARRLPRARILARSPLGLRPETVMNEGVPLRPLGPWTGARRRELAAGADLVVIGGGELLHAMDDVFAGAYGGWIEGPGAAWPTPFFVEGLGGRRSVDTPVAWHAVSTPAEVDEPLGRRLRAAMDPSPLVSVRDHASRRFLERAGVSAPIAVVPDPLFLLGRWFEARTLRRRAEWLAMRGVLPPDGPALVVQANPAYVRHADALAHALDAVRGADEPIVLMATFPASDGPALDALAARIPGHVWRMPADSRPEDLLATLASAGRVVASSLLATLAAAVWGVPFAVLNLDGRRTLAG
ncbi:MAG: polysaccharide pyruvyl transferase family protein, partial [Miltoncostaeaceae bacterium]